MRWLRDAVAVAVADVRERSRSSKLLVVPVVVAYFAKLVAVDTTLVVGGEYTGVPTAAWYGGMVAGIGTTALLFFGFPLVKGSVERDRTTGVGELVATAPLSNGSYLAGKWASNLAVLTVAAAVLAAATAVAFALGGTGPFDVVALGVPFLLVTMPAMAVVAAAAVCFETVRALRGTAGTALYFVLAFVGVLASLPPDSPMDLTGLAILRDSMVSAISTQYAPLDGPVGFAYTNTGTEVSAFRWAGIRLTPDRIRSRLPVVAVACALSAAASLSFDRFDESGGRSLLGLPFGGSDDEDEATPREGNSRRKSTAKTVEGVSLPAVSSGGFDAVRAFRAELRMAVRGRRRSWYVVAAAAVAATLLAPFDVLRSLVVPLALLVPLPVWSESGARERLHRTEELVFANTEPVRLLAVSYLAGVCVGVGVVAPAFVRFALSGSTDALLGGAAAVAFLPAAATAAGVWAARPALFEIAYLVVWYVGPMNGVGPLDYVAANPTTKAPLVPVAYLACAAVAAGVAAAGRHRQFG